MVHSSLSPKLLRRYTLRLSYLEYIANCVHLASCLATVSYSVTLKPFGLSRCALGAFAKYQYFSGTQSAHPCDTVSCASTRRTVSLKEDELNYKERRRPSSTWR